MEAINQETVESLEVPADCKLVEGNDSDVWWVCMKMCYLKGSLRGASYRPTWFGSESSLCIALVTMTDSLAEWFEV